MAGLADRVGAVDGRLSDGLVRLLTERGFVVARAVSDPSGLEQAVAADRPDVAVVDIRMQPTFTDEGAVEKHIANIFSKLDLPVTSSDHRRVLAVLRYLDI